MFSPATHQRTDVPDTLVPANLRSIEQSIQHAAHLLPSQGPIEVFVHHNTLHAFEDLPFESGVVAGGSLFGCNAYLSEDEYREKLGHGRFRVQELEAVLLDDLGDEADRLVAIFGTRYALRLAMLQFTLRSGPTAELRWAIAETDALRRFRDDVQAEIRQRMIAATRQWVIRDLQTGGSPHEKRAQHVLAKVLEQFNPRTMESWSEKSWEAFVLNFLWRVCENGVQTFKDQLPPPQPGPGQFKKRHRDLLLAATGEDADVLVNDVLIRFCSAFLDQGFATWEFPDRHLGIYRSFLKLYSMRFASPTRGMSKLKREAQRLAHAGLSPLESIQESLSLLGVHEEEHEEFLKKSLLALRGWAGIVWQLETNAAWMPHPAAPQSLVEFLAVRLILDRQAVAHVARKSLGFRGKLDGVREAAVPRLFWSDRKSVAQRAFEVFQLAQVRGWKPKDLQYLSLEQWRALIGEIDAFPALERQRIFQAPSSGNTGIRPSTR